jgi:DNA-directed RNA polymerase III subunit RPC7
MAPRQGPRVKKEGKGDLYRIGGVDIPYDPDLELDKPKPTPLYPEYKVPTPKPLTDSEKIQVARFRSLRESIHNGPLYTILGDNVRVGKPGDKPAASFDPFAGMPKYSSRYTKKRRMIPKLDTRPYGLSQGLLRAYSNG